MPKISRNGDKCSTGHLCTKAAPVRASQFTVFAEGQAILVKGDKLKPHFILKTVGGRPRCVGHKASVRGASRKVFVQGRRAVRKGDAGDKGKMKGAAFTVHAG